MFDLKCDPKGIAGDPVNCNLTFMTQDPSYIVNVESSWLSYTGKIVFEESFDIKNRNYLLFLNS